MTFRDYLNSAYGAKKSGTVSSYLKAISILDEIFKQDDIFNLNNLSLSEIRDPYVIENIIDFVAAEENKFRANEPSIFDLGKPTQTSYPQKRFCTAAIRRLGEYIKSVCDAEVMQLVNTSKQDGMNLSEKLLNRFRINHSTTEKESVVKHRIGQNIFRAMLLDIYSSKCCLTGLDVPEVLRASHIIPWSECKETRLNPENGLCLSATYDAAFDKHLITFDEDYKLVLSPMLKETYTSEAFKKYFLKLEGKAIMLPFKYQPSQQFLEKHRDKLIV